MFKGSKKAFTLAEVLITLGIIGVVAAMTMPTLMNSTQGAQYRTAFKKGMSVLSQAATLNFALDDYDFATADQTGISTTDDAKTIYRMFKNRMNVIKTVDGAYTKLQGNAVPGAAITLYLNDGMVFTFNKNAINCIQGTSFAQHSNCVGVIDVNGEKGPNLRDTAATVTSADNCQVNSGNAAAIDDFSTSTCQRLKRYVPDQYTVVYYDQTIIPATAAGRYAMFGK